MMFLVTVGLRVNQRNLTKFWFEGGGTKTMVGQGMSKGRHGTLGSDACYVEV